MCGNELQTETRTEEDTGSHGLMCIHGTQVSGALSGSWWDWAVIDEGATTRVERSLPKRRIFVLAHCDHSGSRGDCRTNCGDAVVGTGDRAEILLAARLAGRGELRDRAAGRRLRGLAAGVGVDLRVEDQDVHVPARAEHVVEAAVADVVGPAVAADDPHAPRDERRGRVEGRPGRGSGIRREQTTQLGDARALHLFGLQADGRLDGKVEQVPLPAAQVRGLAYSEKHARLYVAVDKAN